MVTYLDNLFFGYLGKCLSLPLQKSKSKFQQSIVISVAVNWNNISAWKLLVLDKNTWNHITLCKQIIIDK